jgi:thiosulfate sulfurtransferase
VVCYHGISSQGAANYLIGQDFEDVYSLVGGFTDWAFKFPEEVAKA